MPIQTIRSILFSTASLPEPIVLQQGDYNSRQLCLALFEAPGVPCDLTDADFSVICRKDGINSRPIEARPAEDNLITLLLPGFVAQTHGNGVLQLRMYQHGGLIHSCLLPFTVRPSLEAGEGGEEPAEAFASLLEEAREAIADARDVADHPPMVSDGGTWLVWSAAQGAYTDTGAKAVGASLRVLGSLPDTNALPQASVPGDTYLISGNMYVYNGSAWENIGAANGKDGADGKDGIAATIRFGSVTTLPAGTSATVTNTGTEAEAVLNLGIPCGADGAPGESGGYYTPAVNADGLLTWVASKPDMPPVTAVSIAGPQGPAGADGAPGYHPVRGTDYWTAADIAAIKNYVDEAILGGAW